MWDKKKGDLDTKEGCRQGEVDKKVIHPKSN
jgi:hypothetical protein